MFVGGLDFVTLRLLAFSLVSGRIGCNSVILLLYLFGLPAWR